VAKTPICPGKRDYGYAGAAYVKEQAIVDGSFTRADPKGSVRPVEGGCGLEWFLRAELVGSARDAE
jgi:hypothetical protein